MRPRSAPMASGGSVARAASEAAVARMCSSLETSSASASRSRSEGVCLTELSRTAPLAHTTSPKDLHLAAEEADDGDLRLRRLTAAVSKQQGFLMERDIEALSAQTGYSRPELYARFVRFKALCALGGTPTGVNRATFRRHAPFLAVEDELFVSRVFDLRDGDGAQLLDWDK